MLPTKSFLWIKARTTAQTVVESFEKRIKGEKTRFLYLHETNHSGAASARNSAIDRTKADILIFLDDDVVLEPDFVGELLNVYEKYPTVGGVSGVITNYSPPSLSWRIVGEALMDRAIPRRAPANLLECEPPAES